MCDGIFNFETFIDFIIFWDTTS